LAWFTCGKLTQKLSAMRLRYFVREQKCFQKGRGFSTLKEHKRSHTSGSRLESHGYTPEVLVPHIFVWGIVGLLFLIMYPAPGPDRSAPPSLSHTTLTHTLFHTQLCHTHTPSFTHHLCHTPPFTHHLSHTTLSHTIFHRQLCHTIFLTPSHSHNLVTHIFVTRHLSQTTLSHTQLCHKTSLSHTISLSLRLHLLST